jgi:hypothetical protein
VDLLPYPWARFASASGCRPCGHQPDDPRGTGAGLVCELQAEIERLAEFSELCRPSRDRPGSGPWRWCAQLAEREASTPTHSRDIRGNLGRSGYPVLCSPSRRPTTYRPDRTPAGGAASPTEYVGVADPVPDCARQDGRPTQPCCRGLVAVQVSLYSWQPWKGWGLQWRVSSIGWPE